MVGFRDAETGLFHHLPHSGGAEVPEVTGYVVGGPIGAVVFGVLAFMIGHGHNHLTAVGQQFPEAPEVALGVVEVLQHVPEGDHIEGAGL